MISFSVLLNQFLCTKYMYLYIAEDLVTCRDMLPLPSTEVTTQDTTGTFVPTYSISSNQS